MFAIYSSYWTVVVSALCCKIRPIRQTPSNHINAKLMAIHTHYCDILHFTRYVDHFVVFVVEKHVPNTKRRNYCCLVGPIGWTISNRKNITATVVAIDIFGLLAIFDAYRICQSPKVFRVNVIETTAKHQRNNSATIHKHN